MNVTMDRKKYLTICFSICFHHNGPIWKASVGTGTMSIGLHQPLSDQGVRKQSGVRLAGFHGNHGLPQSCAHTLLSFHVGMCLFIIGFTREYPSGYVGAVCASVAKVTLSVWTWTHRWAVRGTRFVPSGKALL